MSSPVVTFHGPNPGVQVGVNHGSISTISADILNELPIVSGALFDSFENQNEDVCLSGTRTQILQQITTWATSPGPPIFWLKGMAGTGKSTISRTLSKSFAESNLLGASFFFKTGETNRGSAVSLFPTLVRQLVVAFPMISPAVQEALYAHPRVWEKALSVQFNELLLQPLRSLKSPNRPTAVLVIDALDECDDDTNIETIIRLLPQLRSVEAVRVRIFLTSRPELPIRLGFSKILDQHQDFALHEVREIEIKHDISLFLEHRVAKIREDNDLPDDWPGRENIYQLVNISVPLFIFAATACRLLEEDPWELAEVLTDMLICGYDGSKLNWKHQLHGTYIPVLNRFLRKQGSRDERHVLRDFQRIIGSIILLESPLSVKALSELLDMLVEKVKWGLRYFHSVLNIHGHDDSVPIRLFHLSFREFLLDRETSNLTQLWVDEESTHQELSKLCMAVCRRNLKENMCHLDPGTGREEIDSQELHRLLSPALQYSCRYWVHHLVCGHYTEADDIHVFLKEFFLYWMEAMGILGSASQVIRDLNLLQSISSGLRHGELNNFIHDAKRFALRNAQIAHEAPLQLYYSGLLFAPKMSIVRKCFERRLPSWVHLNSEPQKDWGLELQTMKDDIGSGSVTFVALSEDNRILVSLSQLGTIRLWDAITGALQKTCDVDDPKDITSMVVSSNGRYLATIGQKISFWDLSTDVRPKILNGQRAAFYRGNEFLVAVDQLTVRFLNIESGIPTEIQLEQGDNFNEIPSSDPLSFERNGNATGFAVNLELSADGQIIAAMCDWTPMILVWETGTGRKRRGIWNDYGIGKTFIGMDSSMHTFSGQSQILATVPPNRDFICLWNIDTTDLKRAIHMGQHSLLSRITISSDSKLLAFLSSSVFETDRTIQVWEIDSGTLRHVFSNPNGFWFSSLAFSHDCQSLVAGTGDSLIKLWDISGYLEMSETPKAPSERVERVVFSPDGYLIATATGAWHEITVWHAKSGNILSTFPLPAGSDFLRIELAISPNNQRLAVLALASNDSHRDQPEIQDPVAPLMLWELTKNDLWKTGGNYCWSSDGYAFRPPVFSPDSNSLALVCGHGSVRVYDTITKTIAVALEPTTIPEISSDGFPPDLFFSRGGEVLAYRDRAGIIQTWNKMTGALRKLSRSPASDHLRDRYEQNPRMAIDTMHQSSRYTDYPPSDTVCFGTFSPDGRYLVFILKSKVIEIWDVNSGNLLHMAENQTGSEDIVDIVFNRGGLTFLTLLGPREIAIKSEQWEPEWETQDPHIPVNCRVIAVRYDGWVYMRGQRVLWLPHGIRHTSPIFHGYPRNEGDSGNISFHGNTVAWGGMWGDVTILEFDSDCTEASI